MGRNAFDNFVAAAKSLINLDPQYTVFRNARMDPKTNQPVPYSPAEQAMLVRRNAMALSSFRLGLPFPYQEPEVRTWNAPLPYLDYFHGLAHLLTMEGDVQERRGASGVNSYLDIMDLGGHIQHSTTLVSHAVGNSCQAIGRRSLWKAIDRLDAPAARAATHRLEGILAHTPPLADSWREEKWGWIASLQNILHQPDWRETLLKEWIKGEPMREFDAPRLKAYRWSLWREGKRQAIEEGTRFWDACIVYVSQTYAAHPRPPLLPLDPICGLSLPFQTASQITEIWCLDVNHRAFNVLLMTRCALRAYYAEHGVYPPSLQMLVTSGILRQLPLDPFAAKEPLHYQQTGMGYILYSIGPDGKDDGGDPAHRREMERPVASVIQGKETPARPDALGDLVVKASAQP